MQVGGDFMQQEDTYPGYDFRPVRARKSSNPDSGPHLVHQARTWSTRFLKVSKHGFLSRILTGYPMSTVEYCLFKNQCCIPLNNMAYLYSRLNVNIKSTT